MRIERIHVDGFGKLTDFDTGSTPLGPLVVVLGPNEAGKSTLFSFLTTALYGFQPASRDRNPHVPWGADEAGGRIHLRTDADECVEIDRKLRSTPSGRLTRGDVSVDLRNSVVSTVDHIPRTVFRQVFAITLAELAGLDEETWARIQDRVLGSMGASDLRSARDVADVLEKEAGEIWRPNRRGNQSLRELRDEMRSLRVRRIEAMNRDGTVRSLMEELESVELRLEDVRLDLKRDKIVVDRVQELLPLKRQLDRVEALRSEGGPRAELDGLPDDVRERVSALEADLARHTGRRAAIEEDLVEPEVMIGRFDATARVLLEHQDRIRRILVASDAFGADRKRASELEDRLGTLELRIDSAAESLLESPSDAGVREAVLAVSLDLIRDRVTRLEAALEATATAKTSSTEPETASATSIIPALVLIGLGAALLAWSASGGPGVTAAGGGAALAVGVALGVLHSRSRATGVPAEPDAAAFGEADSVARLKREVESMLDGLGVRPEYVTPPGLPLVRGLEGLRASLEEYRELSTARELLVSRSAAHVADCRGLAPELNRPEPEDVEEFGATLQRQLRESEQARDGALQAEQERRRLQRTRDAVAGDADRVGQRLSELRAHVESLDSGDTAPALEIAQRRLDAHARADRIEDELERAHPDLIDLKARIREIEEGDQRWSVGEAELTERKVRIEEAALHLEELVGRAKELERDAAHLRDLETVDAVDSELESLRERETRLVFDRDRKWVLAQLIREADRRFREEHQPDLLKRASSYLSRLTEGRYERLLVDERAGADLFQLVGPGLPRPVPLARPISTGTLEQAYLSLRLAIVDHLDSEQERLPLFIDEAFVNWDDGRRDRGLEVLAEVSRSRQVFAFTCHPEMASLLESQGARIVRLER